MNLNSPEQCRRGAAITVIVILLLSVWPLIVQPIDYQVFSRCVVWEESDPKVDVSETIDLAEAWLNLHERRLSQRQPSATCTRSTGSRR